MLSKSENSYNKNVFLKKNFRQALHLNSSNANWKPCCKTFAKFRYLCDQILNVVIGQKIVFLKASFPQNFYWRQRTQIRQAYPFFAKISKTSLVRVRKKVTTLFFLEKNSCSKRLLWTYKNNFENHVINFLPKNRKLILQSTKKESWKEFFSKQGVLLKKFSWTRKKQFWQPFQKNLRRSSENFWPNIWNLSIEIIFYQETISLKNIRCTNKMQFRRP